MTIRAASLSMARDYRLLVIYLAMSYWKWTEEAAATPHQNEFAVFLRQMSGDPHQIRMLELEAAAELGFPPSEWDKTCLWHQRKPGFPAVARAVIEEAVTRHGLMMFGNFLYQALHSRGGDGGRARSGHDTYHQLCSRSVHLSAPKETGVNNTSADH
jgi:hypothetical protein